MDISENHIVNKPLMSSLRTENINACGTVNIYLQER